MAFKLSKYGVADITQLQEGEPTVSSKFDLSTYGVRSAQPKIAIPEKKENLFDKMYKTEKGIRDVMKQPTELIFNALFDLGTAYEEKILKPVARVVLPKRLEYKTGITKRPVVEFVVGEGSSIFGKKGAEQTVRKQPQVLLKQSANEFYNDIRLAEQAFSLSKNKFDYIDTLGTNLTSKTLTAIQGKEGAINKEGFGDKWIQEAGETLEKLRETDPMAANLIDSLSFSLSSQGAALASAAGVTLLTKSPTAGALTASGVSGVMAYRMASYQIMDQYLGLKENELGRELTQEERSKFGEEFSKKATEFGLWEAIPEAIAGGLGFGLLEGSLTKMVGATTTKNLLFRLGAFYSEELATETVTEMGQRRIMAQTGFPNVEDIDWTSETDWIDALKEVAPMTIILSTILGGSAGMVSKIQTVRQEIKDPALQKAVIQKISEDVIKAPQAEPVPAAAPVTEIEPMPTAEPAQVAQPAAIEETPKEVEPLAEEARKYKSAEEFVKSKGKTVYHGSPAEFEKFSYEFMGEQGTSEGYGFYFTDKKEIAKGYQGERGKTFEVILDIKKPLSFTEKKITKPQLKKFIKAIDKDGSGYLSNWGDASYEGYEALLDKAVNNEFDGSDNDVDMIHGIINAEGRSPELTYPILKETLGYDGIIVDKPDWGGDQKVYLAFSPEQITETAQLTDIWNKSREAIKTRTPKKVESKEAVYKPIKEAKPISPMAKEARVAKSIEAKAIEKGLTTGFEDVAEYNVVVIKEQAAMASKLIEQDIEKAKRIATGKEALPEGLKGATMIKAMEDYAMKTKDGQLALDLANSPLVAETSVAGQTLRLIREREPDSAAAKIQEIKKEREKVSKKKRKGKSVSEVKEEIKSDIKEEVKKTKTSKFAWTNLIDEITC